MNPGENPNWPYEEYNIAQLGIVTEDDGAGGFRLKTSGGGGGGDATAANQVLQLNQETATAVSSSNIEAHTANIETSNANIETSNASIQGSAADIAVSTNNIDTNTAPLSGILSSINTDTGNILGSVLNVENYTAQLKGSLCPVSKVRWNTATDAIIGPAHMIIGFYDVTNKAWLNPYGLNATPFGQLTADEIFTCLQHAGSATIINYTNCVSKANRTLLKAGAPAIIDVDIYYAAAH